MEQGGLLNQVLVHPDDQIDHRFLWRSNTREMPSVFQWLRINFGDKLAPDITTNAIKQPDKVSQAKFEDAAKEQQDHTYVDNFAGSKGNIIGQLEGLSKRSCLNFLTQVWVPMRLVSSVSIKFRVNLKKFMEFRLQLR